MKHPDEDVDFSVQITWTAEFSSERMMKRKKCIHLCNLSSATIYFFRVTRLCTAWRNCKKNFIFLSSADYIRFRFEFLLSFDVSAAGKKFSTFSLFYLQITEILFWDFFSWNCTKLLGLNFHLVKQEGKIYFNFALCCSRDNLLQFLSWRKKNFLQTRNDKVWRKTISRRISFNRSRSIIFPAVVMVLHSSHFLQFCTTWFFGCR